MIKFDEKITADLSAIQSSMKSLHRFWVKAGAISDSFEKYSLRVNPYIKVKYDPVEATLDFYSLEQGHKPTHILQHGEGGVTYFNYRMDEIGGLYQAITDSIKTIDGINNKVVGISPEFEVEIESKDLIKVVNNLHNAVLKQTFSSHGVFSVEELANKNIVMSSSPEGNSNYRDICVDMDLNSKKARFFKNSPTGEASLILEIHPRGFLEFPFHIAEAKDKVIIMQACLEESRSIYDQISFHAFPLKMLS